MSQFPTELRPERAETIGEIYSEAKVSFSHAPVLASKTTKFLEGVWSNFRHSSFHLPKQYIEPAL